MAGKQSIKMENSSSVIKKTFDTNYNGKLACNNFIDIDVAPAAGISEKKLESLEVMISTADASHPPVKARLTDLCRLPLYQISNIITWQSHGITAQEFINLQEAKGHNLTTKMAVYFYQKQQS